MLAEGRRNDDQNSEVDRLSIVAEGSRLTHPDDTGCTTPSEAWGVPSRPIDRSLGEGDKSGLTAELLHDHHSRRRRARGQPAANEGEAPRSASMFATLHGGGTLIDAQPLLQTRLNPPPATGPQQHPPSSSPGTQPALDSPIKQRLSSRFSGRFHSDTVLECDDGLYPPTAASIAAGVAMVGGAQRCPLTPAIIATGQDTVG